MFRNLEIQQAECHGDQPTFIVENPAAGSFVEVNEPTAVLLSCLKDASDREDGIEKFRARYPAMDAAAIRSFIEDKLLKAMTTPASRSRSFLYHRLFLSGATVDIISSKLCFLFNKKTGTACFVIASLLDMAYLIMSPNLIRFSGNIDAMVIILLFTAIIASSLFHEFGHAAAARKFGIDTGGIGVGLYINFPVFYTDVTRVWRLPKRQKCVVNLAGIYFQLLTLTPVIILHQATGSEILRYFVIATNFSFILNLNPFFRFDGYWLVTDIIGVPNLRKRSRELFKYFLARILRFPTPEIPYLLRIKGTVRHALTAYAIIVNLFLLYYLFFIIPMFIYNFLQGMPSQFHQLIICLSNNIMPPFALIRNLISELLFVVIIGFMLYRLSGNYGGRKTRKKTA